MNNRQCDYGCGKQATTQFKNGKFCCSNATSKCASQKELNSKLKNGKFAGIQYWKTVDYNPLTPWNKGKHLSDECKKKISDSHRGKYVKLSPEKEQARRKKISESMRKNPACGGLREGSGRGRKMWYTSKIAGRVYLRSTYEMEYAKWLDNNNIVWKQNLIKFPYTYDGKIHYYYPDFYLPDTNEYVEVKGFKTEKDIAKWKEFPYKLTILMRSDLKLLGCNII